MSDTVIIPTTVVARSEPYQASMLREVARYTSIALLAVCVGWFTFCLYSPIFDYTFPEPNVLAIRISALIIGVATAFLGIASGFKKVDTKRVAQLVLTGAFAVGILLLPIMEIVYWAASLQCYHSVCLPSVLALPIGLVMLDIFFAAGMLTCCFYRVKLFLKHGAFVQSS
jgi:hypothetical protein